MEAISLAIVSSSALALWLASLYMMRGITPEGPHSDAVKHVAAAASVGAWKWPSGMHNFASGKSSMKDMGILLLVVMQRVFRDKTTFFPVAAGSALAHSISIVLIFLVANEYWGLGVGLLMAFVYASSLWTYMIILQGGLQGLALMFLLLAVLFLQLGDSREFSMSTIWVAGSGIAFAAMMFSSASSRKFIPLYLAAFIFSQSDAATIIQHGPWKPESTAEWLVLTFGFFVSGIMFVQIVICNIIGPIRDSGTGSKLVINKVPILGRPSAQVINIYRKVTKKTTATLFRLGLSASIGLTLVILWFGSTSFYIAMAFAAAGFFGMVLLLVYPNVVHNFRSYYQYWNFGKDNSHFRLLYADFFQERIGKTLDEGAGGLPWYPRHFWRLVPFHSLYFLAALGYLVYLALTNGLGVLGVPVLSVVLIGISPIIWGEVTRSPKSALPNFPSYGAALIVVGYAVFMANRSISDDHDIWLWAGISLVASVGCAWNMRAVAKDVWPAKMGNTRMELKLKELGAYEFSTYDTQYNEPFLNALPEAVLDGYNIQYISDLKEATNEYVVIPPTNAKGSNFQSSVIGYTNDNELDPILSALIESKEIVQYAVGCYKTLNSSRYWSQNGDIPTYREFFLHEVHDADRWKGLGWILDAKKLKPYLAATAAASSP